MSTLSFADFDKLQEYAEQFARQNPDAMKRVVSAEGLADLPRWAAHMIAKWRKHPVLREYVQYLQSVPVIRNTAAWHARGEQLMTALTFACQVDPKEAIVQSHYEFEIQASVPVPVVALTTAMQLQMAMPYLWRRDIMNAVLTSPPLPAHVPSRSLLPFPLMYWSLEVAHPVVGAGGLKREINWFCIIEQGESFAILYDLSPSPEQQRAGERITISGGKVEYGEEFPPAGLFVPRNSIGMIVLKMLAFLHSPYVTTESGKMPRGLRRRCLGSGVPAAETEQLINVLSLRQAQKESEARGGTRDWQHQWWVAGHYRAQWIPSEQAHRVIWIAPYIKGPADKPFVERVYDVKR